jgi:hypothetical protein
MMIDFTNAELDLIFECLDERRLCSDDEEELETIDLIMDKLMETA